MGTLIEDQIITRWAHKVSPDSCLPKYPRPQLKRNEWKNLNGTWTYAIKKKGKSRPKHFSKEILVPFPIESALSGVAKKLNPRKKLWYKRTFVIPKDWKSKQIILHFGAVDWEATAWVNGKQVGRHRGGYTPFSFNISKYITYSGENELVVGVWDPTNKTGVVRGKQTLRPWGIKYTSVSGIWQTVWLEPVFSTHIESIQLFPDIDQKSIELKLNVKNPKQDDTCRVTISDDETQIIEEIIALKEKYEFSIVNPKLWSPQHPHLYDLKIHLIRSGEIIDEVSSYFGMRKIQLSSNKDEKRQISLNNKNIFQFGVLDQGYWPDGLYTAPTDEALKYDIEIAKELGFNMIRKHVKVEPARWYYHCDQLGMLVWQDMPNGGGLGTLSFLKGFLKRNKKYNHNLKEYHKKQFYQELREMINALFNHPSIIMWVPFNEGWGQFETKSVVNYTRDLDHTRLLNNASGWFDHEIGDISDCHEYVGPAMPNKIKGRAPVCGEFGGLGLKINNHLWKKRIKFVYDKLSNSEELTQKYAELITKLKDFKQRGLTAGVYTQLTDVEGEINGLLTYDREIIKIKKEKLQEINKSVNL
ncbi:MAG: glycoside hydrolase family 2 TIM barrel-domain containing protein [Promethearchaeia archaeon]